MSFGSLTDINRLAEKLLLLVVSHFTYPMSLTCDEDTVLQTAAPNDLRFRPVFNTIGVRIQHKNLICIYVEVVLTPFVNVPDHVKKTVSVPRIRPDVLNLKTDMREARVSLKATQHSNAGIHRR